MPTTQPTTTSNITGPTCHDFGITGYGSVDDGVMFVGIAPGKDEIRRTHRPFTGPSGRLLDSCLSGVGWSRDRIYTTNVICWYKDDPTPDEIQPCLGRLHKEISIVNPKLIVTCGKIATETLIPDTFGRWRGYPYWSEQLNCYILPTYHTSAVLQSVPGTIEAIVRDLKKIPIILNWPPRTANSLVEWYYAESTEHFQRWLDRIQPNQRISLDIETGTQQVEESDVFEGQLLCFACTTEFDGVEHTIVVQPKFAQGLTWPLHAAWTFQNGPFDQQGLIKFLGVKLPIVHDTMLQSYALDERKGIHGLKPQAREYLGTGYYERDVSIHIKSGRGATLDNIHLHEYNAKDSAYTYRLSNLYDTWLRDDNVYDLYINQLMPAQRVFSEIQYRGVRIDYPQMKRVGLELMQMQLDMDDQLVAYCQQLGFPGMINFNSPLQMRRLLYDILKLPIIKYTKTGQPSTDKDVLEALADAHPFMTMLSEYRHLSHTTSAFVIGIDDDIKVDGLVHPAPLPHTTRTGRLTYNNPPVQIILKPGQIKTDLGRKIERVRSFFIPHNPDTHFLVEADLQRAELWTAYAHSHDDMMLADLQSDFHAAVAKDIFNLADDDIDDYWRRKSKYVTFGIMFGRGAQALAEGELQCTKQEAQTFVDRWYTRYDDYFKWCEAIKREARTTGEVVAPFTGRKRRFHLIYGDHAWHQLNQAVNHPIQSTSHDVLLSALIELHYTLAPLDSYILWETHDSILAEVAHAHKDEALQLIRDTMTRPRFPGMCGIPVDMKIGPNWYDMVKIRVPEHKGK